MPGTVIELKDKLMRAIDAEGNVLDMALLVEVIGSLEQVHITAEELRDTRLGLFINIARRKTEDKYLAKRMKHLVKQWQQLVHNFQNGVTVANQMPPPTSSAPSPPPPPPRSSVSPFPTTKKDPMITRREQLVSMFSAVTTKTQATPTKEPVSNAGHKPSSDISNGDILKSLVVSIPLSKVPASQTNHGGHVTKPLSTGASYVTKPIGTTSGHVTKPLSTVKSYVTKPVDASGHVTKPVGTTSGHVTKPIGTTSGHVTKPMGSMTGHMTDLVTSHMSEPVPTTMGHIIKPTPGASGHMTCDGSLVVSVPLYKAYREERSPFEDTPTNIAPVNDTSTDTLPIIKDWSAYDTAATRVPTLDKPDFHSTTPQISDVSTCTRLHNDTPLPPPRMEAITSRSCSPMPRKLRKLIVSVDRHYCSGPCSMEVDTSYQSRSCSPLPPQELMESEPCRDNKTEQVLACAPPAVMVTSPPFPSDRLKPAHSQHGIDGCIGSDGVWHTWSDYILGTNDMVTVLPYIYIDDTSMVD